MRSVLLFLVLFPACQALAQECMQTMPAILVNEETRKAVPSITADRLHAKIGKVALPITSVEPITSFRVLILIDTSGSMDPTNTPFTHLRSALEVLNKELDELLDQLPPGVQLEFGVFNNNAAYGTDFTADAQLLRKSLVDSTARTKRSGVRSTALYDAIKEGLEHFDPAQPGDSILTLTDGADNISRSRPEKIQEEAARKGIRLFTVLFLGGGVVATPTEGSPQAMFDFGERTGGSVHVVNVSQSSWIDAKEREKARQELRRFWNNEVLSGYLLRFNVPASARKQRKWMLSVDRLPGQKTKTLAAYPSRLNACPVATAAAH